MPLRILSSFGNLRRKLAYEWFMRDWWVPVHTQLVDFEPRVLCMYTFKGHGTRIGIRLYVHLLFDMDTYRGSSFKLALNRQAGDTFKVGHSKSSIGPDFENTAFNNRIMPRTVMAGAQIWGHYQSGQTEIR